MAKQLFIVAVEADNFVFISRYISRALKNYYKQDPEEAFDKSEPPHFSVKHFDIDKKYDSAIVEVVELVRQVKNVVKR